VTGPAITAADYLRAVENGDDGLAAFYAEILDEPCVAEAGWYERPEALRLSALHYARTYGLPVLPLAPGRKVPIGGRCCRGAHARGCIDATTDPAQVEAMWTAHPTANVGIATGHRVDVVDQDGPAGAVSWAEIGRAEAWPEVLGLVLTPRAGGVHRYIAASGDGNGTAIAPGLDFRGKGGYCVAPPSIVDGRRYSWAIPLDLRPTR
jgi:hypothetical protein